MRSVSLASALLLLAGALSVPTAAADCPPPCGPIPVFIEIDVGPKKNYAFGAEDSLVLEGKVSFYVDIDNDGFWYDPQNPPKLTFRVNKQPPWVRTTVEPMSYEIPISDATYVSEEGSPGQAQYYWEAPIQITVDRVRDPTEDEISKVGKLIRADGTFRILVSASTTGSVLAPDVFGPNMGLQEGYGVKELRMLPEIGGVVWAPNEQGVLAPGDGIVPQSAKGEAPAPLGLLSILALLAVVGLRRRR